MNTSLSTDEHRILNFHIQMLLTLANDARAIAIHERLYEEGLVERSIKTARLNPENAGGFIDSFRAVMAFLGYEGMLIGPIDDLSEQNRRLSIEVSLKLTEIDDLNARNRRVENERLEAQVVVSNLKSQLAARDSEIAELRTIISDHAHVMVEQMEVAGIPF